MSLSKFRDGSPQHWKEKYFKLLESYEQFERDCKESQESFSKAILILSGLVESLDESLSPLLGRIRDLLKSNIQNQRLRKEVDAFSNALTSYQSHRSNKQVVGSLLFDFLEERYPDRLKDLRNIKASYHKQVFSDRQSLFRALMSIVEEDATVRSDLGPELSDCRIVVQAVIRLLDSVDVPESLIEDARQLKLRLLSGQALPEVFNDVVSLLLTIKKHIQAEQQEMADFLSTLTEELANLGLKAAGVNNANEDALKKRDSHDKDVAEQVADLQRKSATATQLEPLKQLVSIRLQSISEQIQKHNANEQAEKDRNQRELTHLMQKIREMESETSELKARLDAAQKKAACDSLTGLPNRQALEERLTLEIARAKRYGSALSVAVWDIDYFKSINDTYGHKSGDKALIIIAKLLSQYCRETDFVARFGGEEFVTLLPETDVDRALSVVDKLREVIEKCGFKANGDLISITVSCGLTQYTVGDTSESIFVRADRGMYQAKQGGRNQCVIV
ncbi:diguanylate cyclase [Methylomonas sp. MgM2]